MLYMFILLLLPSPIMADRANKNPALPSHGETHSNVVSKDRIILWPTIFF